jgi:hypothetical protein
MAHTRTPATPYYGLMAEFGSADELLTAARRVREAGYTKFDPMSPFPIHGMGEAIGFKERSVAKIVLLGGILGLLGGYSLEYYTQVIDWPMNIGGRPPHAWPMFVPPAFETTILLASISALVGMLALNGLPQPYHPLFNIPSFELASRSHFFLCIEARDPKFDLDDTRQFLEGLAPISIYVVPTGRVKPPRRGAGAKAYPAAAIVPAGNGPATTTNTTTA